MARQGWKSNEPRPRTSRWTRRGTPWEREGREEGFRAERGWGTEQGRGYGEEWTRGAWQGRMGRGGRMGFGATGYGGGFYGRTRREGMGAGYGGEFGARRRLGRAFYGEEFAPRYGQQRYGATQRGRFGAERERGYGEEFGQPFYRGGYRGGGREGFGWRSRRGRYGEEFGW